MYRFLDSMRLQLWFETPNICASFLAMTIMLTIGLFLCVIDKKTIMFRGAAIALISAVVVQQVMLAMTYSRGGYIAFAAGMLFMWHFSRKRWIWVYLLSFAAIILFMSNGIDRVHSITQTGDGSIYHRLLLWKGGLSILADNWLTGSDAADRLYYSWHQPLWLNGKYGSFINDYLTIGTSSGIVTLFGYFSLALIIFNCGIKLWRKTKSQLLLTLLSIIIAYLISAAFSNFYNISAIFWLAVSLMVLTLCGIVYAMLFRRFRPGFLAFMVPCAVAMFLCLILLTSGWLFNLNMPYAFKYATLQNNGREVNICEAHPKKNTPKALVIYFFSFDSNSDAYWKNSELANEVRTTVRPLLARNYAVIAAGVDSGLDGAKDAVFILRKIIADRTDGGEPVFLIGTGDGGKQAIIAAARTGAAEIKGVVALGSPASWPFDEISPIRHLHKLKVPLLLLHGEQDSTYPPSESFKLKKGCDENNIPAECKIIKDAGSQSSNHRELALKLIDKFMAGQIANAMDIQTKTLEMQVFVKSGCKHCQEFESVLNKIKTEYGSRLQIYKHNISDGNERILYAAYCNLYGIRESGIATPAVFVSRDFVSGEEAVEKTDRILGKIFADKQHQPTGKPTWREIAAAENALVEQFNTVPLFAIIIAGLIDGINPCVFSTLVFFISLLSVSKIKHKKLLLTGCVYCIACYVTYFSMGLGILSLFSVINQFKLAGLIMNCFMIGLLALLVFFSLRDAYYFRKTGKAGAVTLQLPDSMKRKIHDLMRKGLRYRFLIPGAFFIGIFVTIIESTCTAQVYIPTLGIISKHGGLSMTIILYLALYNLMCICPLIAVFAFAYQGTTTNAFIHWTKNDLVIGKLLMSALFILLAVLLIFSMN